MIGENQKHNVRYAWKARSSIHPWRYVLDINGLDLEEIIFALEYKRTIGAWSNCNSHNRMPAFYNGLFELDHNPRTKNQEIFKSEQLKKNTS